MAHIIPFKGYRYNSEKIDNLGKVLAPPYDTISRKEAQELYELHENNVVRLDRGLSYESDTEEENCYTRAANYMKEWIEQDILLRDGQNAIYMYEQEIAIHDTTFTNKGFIALLELEEFDQNIVIPCEDTIAEFKEDRYKLLKSTNANTSMINCMYVEQEKRLTSVINDIAEKVPDAEFTLESGIIQRLWIITDVETIGYIQKNLEDKQLFITDGQNRYETCLEYRRQMMKQNPNHTGNERYNYVMTLLTNTNEDGLILFPVHRLVSCPKGFKEEFVVAGVQEHFKVEKIIVDTSVDELVETMLKQIATPRKQNRIALYCGGNYFYRLTFTDFDYLASLMPDRSDAYRSLDVTVLNTLLLGEIMNISRENYHERITFIKNAAKAVRYVQEGRYGCVFLINPTKPHQIRDVALAREKMPERSIYIFPKPATGIVIHRLEDE
jgi:uncharacterized protein (DUF1015 family)